MGKEKKKIHTDRLEIAQLINNPGPTLHVFACYQFFVTPFIWDRWTAALLASVTYSTLSMQAKSPCHIGGPYETVKEHTSIFEHYMGVLYNKPAMESIRVPKRSTNPHLSSSRSDVIVDALISPVCAWPQSVFTRRRLQMRECFQGE